MANFFLTVKTFLKSYNARLLPSFKILPLEQTTTLTVVTDRKELLLSAADLCFHFDNMDFSFTIGMHDAEKTTAICASILYVLYMDIKVLVQCLAEFLASTYKSEFGNSFTANTHHSSFNILFKPQQSPTTHQLPHHRNQQNFNKQLMV